MSKKAKAKAKPKAKKENPKSSKLELRWVSHGPNRDLEYRTGKDWVIVPTIADTPEAMADESTGK